LPDNSVAGHAPQILVHAILADTEAAAALPAEQEFLSAALALFRGFGAASFSARRFGECPIHCLSCARPEMAMPIAALADIGVARKN
jgi:hypothetical protein